MKRWTAFGPLVAAVCIGWLGAAWAAESDLVKEVLKLINAKASEEVILTYVNSKPAPAEMTADTIIELQKAGASEPVILALMKGGKGPVPTPAGGFPFALDDHNEVQAPVAHKLLAVYPIVRKGPVSVENYLTLDEAVDQKVIEIKEKGEGSVPVVIIRNSGKLPIYISAGEIIIGGKQDRIVAYDVIIKPMKEMNIDVKCVERGRWEGGRVEFRSANAMGGRAAKMAAQFMDQGSVWREVAGQNAAAHAESSTDSFQATLNKDEVRKAAEDYADAILPKLDGRNVVGMIVAVNGKIHAIELFASPGLFAKLKGKLLKSYVVDTIGVADAHASPPGKDAIMAFYQTTMQARAEDLKSYEYNANVRRDAAPAAASESRDEDGIMLHRSVLSK